MVDVVIHTNLALANQRWPAAAMREGFRRQGLEAEVTGDTKKAADIHVVQGPWYCYREWLGQPNVLYLDRCFYGDAGAVVSLGWLNADGSRDFLSGDAAQPKGRLPSLKPRKEARRSAIVFADYGRDMTDAVREARREFDAVYYRPHPAERNGVPRAMSLNCDLADVWALGDVAIGHASTVLVDAAIEGLAVKSTDARHVVNKLNGSRKDWLTQLSWAQWDAAELASGAFWEHLHEGIDRTSH